MSARIVGIVLLLSCLPEALAAKLPTEFDGYVTAVRSDHFYVGSREVGWDPHATRIYRSENQTARDAAPAEVIRVGALVHVAGEFHKPKGEFVATAIGIQVPVARHDGEISGVGLIEEPSLLHIDAQGISGTIWADGYPLQITSQTKLLSLDGKDFPADKICPNVWAFYQAVRRPDHSVEAVSIKFSPNVVGHDEAKYRDKSEPEIVPPDYAGHVSGKIKFPYQGAPSIPWKLDILPDKSVQDYVTQVGESLIPEFQKNLSPSDPAKINFRFFVVEKPSRWKEVLNDASSTPGGVIYIPDNVLAALDNEAQLAALLSNCIADTVEKQLYAHRSQFKVQKDIAWASAFPEVLALPLSIGNGIEASRLMLEINVQASRIGLRYMLNSGYDIREAPFAWTAAANKKIENPLEDGASAPPLVRSIMDSLYFDYASADYASLKTNRAVYQQMLTVLRTADLKLPKPKNGTTD